MDPYRALGLTFDRNGTRIVAAIRVRMIVQSPDANRMFRKIGSARVPAVSTLG